MIERYLRASVEIPCGSIEMGLEISGAPGKPCIAAARRTRGVHEGQSRA